ncbi:MAG: hypothetical protein EHM30_08345 [Desulfobacteraceae bacterium]|jgi:hypothetical protein|nr:MAG: hypothetical protein EHM30_08345 [Desulfobacteraceae bacterium]
MVNMREQIGIVVQLQEIEIETDRIKSVLAGVPGRMGSLEAELNNVTQEIEKRKAFVDELRKKYRLYESDYQASLSLHNKSQEKLSAVKNNKEYQSILKEIDDIKAKSSGIEEEMINGLDVIESAEKEVARLKREFLSAEERIIGEKKILIDETEQDKKTLAELVEKWENTAKNISPELMQKFNTVKGLTRGTGIAPVLDSICLGCNMNIPPQMYNELQRFDSIKFCPHCQRIIYWGKE